MNFQTRRTVLKTLTALPVMAFWEPLSRALPKGETKDIHQDLGQLNVVFHGIFAYMYDPKQSDVITAYGLRVEEHVYWAGNWEQEDENVLDQDGPCELTGNFVEPGPAPVLTETAFPVIKCGNPPVKANAACTIRLPIPHKIVGLRSIRKTFEPLLIGEYAPPALKRLPLAYAFTYKYDATKDGRPVLANTHWKAPRRAGPVNLHIRAESLGGGMSGDGFNAIRDFLEYKEEDLALHHKYISCRVGPDLIPRVHGIRPEEEYFLPEMFPHEPEYYPGYLQSCNYKKLSPANCSGIHGILAT